MMPDGYPPYTILLVLGIGLPLAVLRPYAAFLAAILLVTAGHVSMLNETRVPDLVPSLNLMHACLLVALLACFVDRVGGRKAIWMPPIVGLMVFAITIASIQSLWSSGWNLQTARYCRGALDFPLAFFLGANMVTSEGRARKLLGVLLAGALLAAFQHIFVAANIWWTRSLNMKTYNAMRTIGFWAGCLPSAFLIAATSWKTPRHVAARALYGAAGLTLLATLFLNQTRSLWVSTVVATLFVLALFRKHSWVKRLVKSLVCIALLFFAFGCLCRYAFPRLDVLGVMANRADDLLHNEAHMGTRERSFNVEMRDWYDGTLIFGRGLDYFDKVENSEHPSEHIAFGHLGYVTYLSQLGIIGFLVYGVCLPLGVLRNGRRLWRSAESATLCYVALLGTASIICLSILFSMSSHFLLRGYEPAGILYGAMWVLAKRSGAVGTT